MPPPLARRAAVPVLPKWRCLAAVLLLVLTTGCEPAPQEIGTLQHVWGRLGISDGRLQKPRAMTIDSGDRLYIVDMTGRVQVFSAEGDFLRSWKTPEQQLGLPTGLSMGRDGQVLVGDSHYHRVLIYSAEGVLCKVLGGAAGDKPGEFDLVGSVVQDSEGFFYVAEYGANDRIQKLTPDGQFVLQWGGHGAEPGRLRAPNAWPWTRTKTFGSPIRAIIESKCSTAAADS